MKKIWLFLPALLLGGCTARTPEMAAGYTDDPAVMESGDAWKKAAAYDLYGAAEQFRDAHPEIRRLYDNKVQCPGKVSLLYDSRYLYVHAELQDDDLVAESDGDQVMLCNFGDVFEIFLKPADANHLTEKSETGSFLSRARISFPALCRTAEEKPAAGAEKFRAPERDTEPAHGQRPVLECHCRNSACRTCGAGNRIETGKQMENTDCPLQLFQSSAEQGADNLSTVEETEFSCS